jgi:hypothetical protein
MYFLETNIKRFSKASHIELFSMENKEQISGWFDLDIRFEEYRRLFFGECLERFNSFVEDVTTYYKNPNLRGTRVFCFKDERFEVNITIFWIDND